jgi:hypothetical protein
MKSKDVKLRWEGWEWGDLTRDNLFLHQEKKHNVVSFDPEGFRSVPVLAGPFTVLVDGDSNIRGNELSDGDTIPWRLAQRLGVRVFNAAKIQTERVLRKPTLSNVRLVVECFVERDLQNHSPLLTPCEPGNEVCYHPGSSEWEKKCDNLDGRSNLNVLLRRMFHRLIGDLRELDQAGWHPNRLRKMGFENEIRDKEPIRFIKTVDDLRFWVDRIAARDRWMRQHGLRYLFVATPSKEVVYDHEVDDFTRRYTARLAVELRHRGVEFLDLDDDFRKCRDQKKLYWDFDTHLDGAGTELESDKIAEYIRRHHLLLPANSSNVNKDAS